VDFLGIQPLHLWDIFAKSGALIFQLQLLVRFMDAVVLEGLGCELKIVVDGYVTSWGVNSGIPSAMLGIILWRCAVSPTPDQVSQLSLLASNSSLLCKFDYKFD
jgi:hypothetical protein